MDKFIETLIKYKTEREVDEHNESHTYRLGYVKAINDSINLFKKLNGDIRESGGFCTHPNGKNRCLLKRMVVKNRFNVFYHVLADWRGKFSTNLIK